MHELDTKRRAIRALENGKKIAVAETDVYIPPGIDTEDDLLAARERMA